MPLITTLAGGSARGLGGMRTFGPSWDGIVDFLLIAGGGGGAGGHGGAGGAGGFRTSAGTSGGGASAESTLTLTSNTRYTIVVGAGGLPGYSYGIPSSAITMTVKVEMV
jgi:hypothetical protein